MTMSPNATDTEYEEKGEPPQHNKELESSGEHSPITVDGSLSGGDEEQQPADNRIARLETSTSAASRPKLPFSKARCIALVATVATASFTNVSQDPAIEASIGFSKDLAVR